MIKRAEDSFLESEYIDSREKNNEPKCMEYLSSPFIEIPLYATESDLLLRELMSLEM